MARASTLRHPETVLSPGRVLIAVALALLAGAGVALAGRPDLAPVTAWIVATIVALTTVWWVIWPQGPEGTKRIAEREACTRTTDTAVIVAAVLSLGAVVYSIVRTSGGQRTATTLEVVISLAAAVLSWCLINTIFALKYAREYYREDGGIELTDGEPPAYSDFAYVAFVMGMAYSPPETQLTSRTMRKIGLGHTLLAYLFGTGVLAVALNLVANVG
jgi:uncharacterized membrane protein